MLDDKEYQSVKLYTYGNIRDNELESALSTHNITVVLLSSLVGSIPNWSDSAGMEN